MTVPSSSNGQGPFSDWRTALGRQINRLRRPAFFGTMRRTKPLSDGWGYDRGTPIDRYFIERFLDEHRGDIRGRVLEVHDSKYAARHGTGVTRVDVLDIDSENRHATIIADLAAADSIPANLFDCFILTQTLQLIYNVEAAVYHAHRILRPGGVLLLTVPAVSRIVPDYGLRTDFWRFTVASCYRLCTTCFDAGHLTVRSYGNVLTGAAFLMGISYQEMRQQELETHDDYFPVTIAVRAVKR